MYIPLHAHSSIGSIQDSVLSIKDYVKRGADLGLTHLAITDHGSMAGIVEFKQECDNYGIIPIIGMEAYVCENRLLQDKEHREYHHLILLARNQKGLENLMEIHNDAQINGFYYKPRTDHDFLSKHGEGIVALSACVAGEIPSLLLQDKYDEAYKLIDLYRSIFDFFCIEIQPGDFELQITANKRLIEIASKKDINIVVTNDIHYLNKNDYLKHNYHIKSFRKTKDDDNDLEALVYPDTCYWFMTQDDIIASFPEDMRNTVNAAVKNTKAISDRFFSDNIKWDFQMPKFPKVPSSFTEERYLKALCLQSLSNRIHTISNPAMYMDRLAYELDVINQLGFAGYFLIIWDLLRFARDHDITVGPGRGSCGGSLVSWLLDITVADPIKYNLMFERFLSVNRKDKPDIDLDICSDKRYLLQQYTLDTYGYDNCALVGSYSIGKPKSTLRTAGRVLNIDLAIIDKICKCIPVGQTVPTTLQEIIDKYKTIEAYNREYPELFNLAMSLEELPTNLGIHAAGMIISPNSLMKKLPMRKYKDKEDKLEINVSLITKKYVENIGLKFDYLGLNTIKIVEDTKNQVGIDIDLSDDNFYNDSEVWKIIGSKNTDGIFQISSNTYKERMWRIKPKSIKELAACLALIRTPCIMAKTDEQYMRIVEGKEQIEKICPEYDEVMKDTNGICIYQEQLMQMAVNFGFTKDEANDIRKACSKKIPEKMATYEKQFKEYVAQKGYGKNIQDRLFQIVLDSSNYSFNQSHAVCYAILAYESAWLKVHYRTYFMANLLTNAYGKNSSNQKKTVIPMIVNECKQYGIEFLPLDINKSDWKFKVEDNKIRLGMCIVPKLGMNSYNEIIAHRPFTSIEEMNNKINGNNFKKNVVMSAIVSGCFDSISGSTKNAYDEYCRIKKIDTNSYNYNLDKTVKFNITRSSRKSIETKMFGVSYTG